MLRYKKKLDLV